MNKNYYSWEKLQKQLSNANYWLRKFPDSRKWNRRKDKCLKVLKELDDLEKVEISLLNKKEFNV